MKKFITILGVAVMATLTVNAGLVTSWSDDFTGADGTVVAPSANWALTNQTIGIMANPWPAPTDRSGNNEDVYIISNNQFYSYVGPMTLYTNLNANLKADTSFIPQEAGERIGINLSNGTVVLEVDLADMWGNEGGKWGNNLEVKVPLPSAPIVTDSHRATNYYQICFKMSPTSSYNYN